MLKAGDQIGSYRIVEPLQAEGGMSRLFLGRREGAAGFARPVAIKVVHPHLASDPRFIRMFIDEALLSARIAHPNVVHVEELGEIDGTYFLVMEYVPGCSLADLTYALAGQDRRLALELCLAIAIQIADGLHAAHETRGDDGELLGVVHQDVSPQNILLSYQGHIKLIDFGVARARGQANAQSNVLQGKYRYMAPEQARRRGVDRRTDVYALGVVLWEMLTGRRLFDAPDAAQLLARVCDPHVVAPSTFAPDVAPAVDAVVLAALAPEPAHRPATARELRDQLVDAVPGAMAFGPPQLAQLVAAVVGEKLARLHRAHPDAVPDVTAELSATGATEPAITHSESVLGTLTVPARQGADGTTTQNPSVSRHDGTASTPWARSSRRPARWQLAGGIGLLALVAAGSVAAWRLRERAPTSSTQLAPRALAPSAAPVVTPAVAMPAPPAPVVTPAVTPPAPPAPDTAPGPAASTVAVSAHTTSGGHRSHPTTRRRRARPASPRPTTGVPLVRDMGI